MRYGHGDVSEQRGRGLFLSPGVRYYWAVHGVRDLRFTLGYFASQLRLQTFGEDEGTLTTG